MRTNIRKKPLMAAGILTTALATLLALSVGPAQGDDHKNKSKKNMRLVGFNDLQARSAYQPITQQQGDRRIAYIGHHNGSAPNTLLPGAPVQTNGVSIVDVTDPKRPVYLHHLPGVAGAQMVRACSGDELPFGESGHTYLLRSNGNLEHQVFDVTNPSAPVLVSTPVTGLGGTHKSYWECSTGYAYIASGVVAGTTLPGQPPVVFQDWRTNRMTQIFDLSDPKNPVFIRNFGLEGQQPGATGDVPQSLHGCIPVIERNRVYCGHGTRANGHLVILNRDELLHPTIPLADPANPTPAELTAPLIVDFLTPTFMGAHTTFPVLGYELPQLGPENTMRDFIVLVNEAIGNECTESRQMTFMVDITDEVHPYPVSNLNVAEAEGDYCTVGGRFGSHASNENFTSVFYRKMVAISWFNAGVRMWDIRDPFNPKEVAYFIPRITENTDDRNGKFAIQTNNVEVDDRGLVYITDRANTGLHILALTGKARKIIDGRDDDNGDDSD
jgi:hypothetical protein